MLVSVQVALSTHDLSKPASVADMAEFGKKELGAVDIIVSRMATGGTHEPVSGFQQRCRAASNVAEKWCRPG